MVLTQDQVFTGEPAVTLELKGHPIGQGMLSTINAAELAAILVALRQCQSDQDECIATDSKISMQKISKQLHSPHHTNF